MVVNVGGHVTVEVSTAVDYLVTGDQDLTELAAVRSKSQK